MTANTPDGMMPASEFGRRKGISDETLVEMLRSGFFSGQNIDGEWYIHNEELLKEKEKNVSSRQFMQSEKVPVLSNVFFVFAVLSFIGGIVLSAVFLPGAPGYGREWKSEAYVLSILFFMAGVIEAALFAAIGQGLSYLHRLVENTSKR
jgi:hypothetical protein